MTAPWRGHILNALEFGQFGSASERNAWSFSMEDALRRYELVVVLSPDVADDEVPDAIDRLIRVPVQSQGGEVQETDHWGRRKLAYPIQRHMEGNYVLTDLRLDPQRTKELERGLHISEDVLRHLLVRLDGGEDAPASAEL